jgi:hypothetical protein
MTLRTSLMIAAIASLPSLTAVAGEPASTTSTTSTTSTNERVEVRRVVVAGDAHASVPEHSVAVFSRAVDGGAPSMSVQLLGKDGAEPETFDLAEVQVGETKRFTSDSGREVEITRTADGITLAIDGKTIELPGLGGAPGEGTVAWTSDANASGEDTDVVIAGAPQLSHVFVAQMPASIDVESLESVKKLRPEIHDEVVAALEEILASPDLLALHGLPPMAGAFAAAPGPGGEQRHVVVKTIVVDDAKHVQ